jgi:hypothetical protein
MRYKMLHKLIKPDDEQLMVIAHRTAAMRGAHTTVHIRCTLIHILIIAASIFASAVHNRNVRRASTGQLSASRSVLA